MEQQARSNGLLNALYIIISIVVVAAILFPVFARPTPAYRTACLNNLKQIGIAYGMYLQDNGNKYPELATLNQRAPEGKAWPNMVSSYAKNKRTFRCPKEKDRLTYSYNRKLSGIEAKDFEDPSTVMLVFESVSASELNNNLNGDTVWTPNSGNPRSGQLVIFDSNWNPQKSGYPKWVKMNHDDSICILYTDMHVAGTNLERLNQEKPAFDPMKVIDRRNQWNSEPL